MNDRLMIAARLEAALWCSGAPWPSEAFDVTRGGIGRHAWALAEADALIAAAGEGGDPALHENCVGVAIHNVIVDRIQGERDNAICRLTDRDAQVATLQAKVARLERQLEPLTEDEAREATGMMIEELGAKVTGNDGHLLATAYVCAADRIRARRGK